MCIEFIICGITGGGQGVRVPPETSDREIFADLPGKKRHGKRGKGVKIEKKNGKNGRWEIENGRWKSKSYKMRRGLFFCFSLFKTTKICFGSTKMEIFYREKSISRREKIRKNDFAPSEKFSCYAPVHNYTKFLLVVIFPDIVKNPKCIWNKNV